MDNQTLTKMNALANAFANERIPSLLTELEEKIKTSDGGFSWSRPSVEKALGKILATSYAKGYADAVENVGIRRLIF